MNRTTIINVAPTGMVPRKAHNAAVPLAPGEIVADVVRCAGLGAAIAHVHARDEHGEPTADPEIYRQILADIRRSCPDLVITVTTSGRNWAELDRRSAALRLDGIAKPDMASLTLGSLNFSRSASTNSPETIQRLAALMKDLGVKPELEVFDLGMVNYAKYLIKRGLIDPPYYFNLLLGNIGTAQASLLHLATLVAELPEDSIWCVAGIGEAQLAMNVLGMTMGFGARTGLEDNLWMDGERKEAATNSGMVARLVSIAEQLGKRPASAAIVRRQLGLPSTGPRP